MVCLFRKIYWYVGETIWETGMVWEMYTVYGDGGRRSYLKEDEFIEIKQYKVQLNIVTSAQIYWCPCTNRRCIPDALRQHL
jgi:hypothetical protein